MATIESKQAFSQNMDVLLTITNTKELVRQANDAGIKIDYSYVMNVLKGTMTPSLEKCEQIVRVLQQLPLV